MSYLRQVWQVNRAVGWMLILNVALAAVISLGFTKHFPDSTGTVDSLYQLGLLPAVWGLYAILAALFFIPLTFIPRSKWPLMVMTGVVGGTLSVILFIDSYIYDIFNFHINWFFISAFFSDEGGEFFDISWKTYLLFSFVAVVVTALELFFLWLIVRKLLVRQQGKWAGMSVLVLLFVNAVFVNLVHSWAYAQNYMPVTSISGHVPFYFPMHSRSLAKNSALANMSGDKHLDTDDASVQYPKQLMQCSPMDQKKNVLMVVLESWRADSMTADITPNTNELAQKSLWFKDHHSSGTVTTRGIFSLMYGLAPTYMDAVVANNGAGGPVLINLLKENGYDFGVYPSGDITRIKLTDSSFSPIKDSVQHGEGSDTIEKDLDILKKMESKIQNSDGPFFGFMFFNSSHYLYYYPDEHERFTPVKKPSLVDFKKGENPEPYLNRYKNSLVFVDDLIGRLIQSLKQSGKWDDTILIITSDHAEEFADTHDTRFGHGSNYTRYQSQVPLVIHWPGKEAKVIEQRTASIDVAPTLVSELFDCSNEFSDYTSGVSLFDDAKREFQIMASYYNYAVVTEQGSFVQNPIGIVEAKNGEDQAEESLSLPPGLALKALQQMKHFYKNKAD